jgi:hypothetical protein
MSAFFDSVMLLDWPVLAAGLAAIVFVAVMLKRLVSRLRR